MYKATEENNYILDTLAQLLSIPSPSGYTDRIVHYVCSVLKELDIPFELTRRGAIKATIEGASKVNQRALVAHLDTLGMMVKNLKANGRLEVVPIGYWSSRFAEGARVTIFSEKGPRRGTVLPLKASGHTFNEEIDKLPIHWNTVEVRLDDDTYDKKSLIEAGYNIGDFIAVDPNFEFTENGFINSRHLDNKAGVACLLAFAKRIKSKKLKLPITMNLLFTISEEVGSGASAVLHGDVAEMVSIDNSTLAEGQNSSERGVTVAIKDSSGPFDYHLTHKILSLCKEHKITHSRDVFRYYRCDAASAIEAGNDIRTALVCFACDGSHGYEQSHMESLSALVDLLSHYAQTDLVVARDKKELSGIEGFPTQPIIRSKKLEVDENIIPTKYDK